MNEIHIKSDAKYIDIHHNDVVNIDISTKEPASEDLEEISKKYSSCIYLEEVLSDDDKEVLKERLVNTFKAGAQWQKEQMVKDAVDADAVYHSGDGTLFSPEILPDYVNPGDKVKLIIIKED